MNHTEIKAHRQRTLREDGKPLNQNEWAVLLGASNKVSLYELAPDESSHRKVPPYIARNIDLFRLLEQHAPAVAKQQIKEAVEQAKTKFGKKGKA